MSDPTGDVIGPFGWRRRYHGLSLSTLRGGVRFTLKPRRLSASEDVLGHWSTLPYAGEEYQVDAQQPGLGDSVYLYRTTGGNSTQLGRITGGSTCRDSRAVRPRDEGLQRLGAPQQPMTRGSVLTVGDAYTSANISTMDSIPASGCPFRAG